MMHIIENTGGATPRLAFAGTVSFGAARTAPTPASC